MIGSGVLPDAKHEIASVKVLEAHGTFACSDRLGEGNTTRFVAHVRTVREIACAEQADKELVEECGLIAGAT